MDRASKTKPRAIVPPALREVAEGVRMSPAILSRGHLFLTGTTGANTDGTMPEDAETQFRVAFAKIGAVLNEAGLSFADIVEMTSYHIGLRAHFDLFDRVRLDHMSEPWPAWTAVEVAGLRREGAIVEIRVIAQAPDQGTG